MKEAKKTIRRYVGLKKLWKIVMAALAVVMAVCIPLNLWFKGQPEPQPVPFDAMTAQPGDYCYFDAVGVSTWLYEVKTENGSYTDWDFYYLAMDAEGRYAIVNMDLGAETKLFSQQMYFNGASLSDEMPKPYRMKGLVKEMKGGAVRKNLAEVLGIDAGAEYSSYFGDVFINEGSAPKKDGAAAFEIAAISAGLGIFFVFMANMAPIAGAGTCLRKMEKAGRLEEAAAIVSVGDGRDPIIVGDGFVFVKNKGSAIWPEAVKDAVCEGTSVRIWEEIDLQPITLNFNDAGGARRFMEFIPLECICDDDVMIKTRTPEKYDYI